MIPDDYREMIPADRIISALLQARKEAQERARGLLLRCLSNHQRAMFEQYDFFYVKAKDGVFYALHDGYFIAPLDRRGKPQYIRGIHVQGVKRKRSLISASRREELPREDGLLAQTLLLRTDPTYVDKVACIFPYHHGNSYYTRDWPAAIETGEHFKRFLA